MTVPVPPPGTLDRSGVLELAAAIGWEQFGGTLATIHAEDGTPYVTFVLYHLRPDGTLLFGSLFHEGRHPQHARNILATPEVSFLIDNRGTGPDDWERFTRIVIEGAAEIVPPTSPRYQGDLEDLRSKNRMAASFAEKGDLVRIYPRRLIVMQGFSPQRHVIEFVEDDD